MGTFLTVVLVVLASAVCSWELGVSLCNHVLVGRRAFDFVCGHNAPLQLLPSFLLFIVVFSSLARAMWRRQRSGGQGVK
jgi:hypothetical protein